jgi:hypothetical protein
VGRFSTLEDLFLTIHLRFAESVREPARSRDPAGFLFAQHWRICERRRFAIAAWSRL